MTPSDHATPEGTAAYAARFKDKAHPDFFRPFLDLTVSCLGIGTYLGTADDATDALYEEAIVAAVQGGINLIDTASSYRCQRSERAVGRALRRLARAGIGREEIVVCTKAGIIPFDGSTPSDPEAWFFDRYVETGLVSFSDVVAGSHCLHPKFLGHEIDQSRHNLGVETFDLLYIHNPETQLMEIDPDMFRQRMLDAFVLLEERVSCGEVRFYGISTWNGLRREADAPDHLSLEDLVTAARQAGGEHHHFKAVQLPFNRAMPEAFLSRNQSVGGGTMTVLDAARELGLSVFCSAALFQGKHAIGPQSREGAVTPAQEALQVVRSTPGVTAILAGMKQVDHVRENLGIMPLPPMGAALLEAGLSERS